MVISAQKKNAVILGERRYPLNKCKSKYVSVGLAKDCEYKPMIALRGSKGECIKFDEIEWEDFLSHQGVITNYLYSNDKVDTVHSWTFSIFFEQVSYNRIIRIWKDDANIYLGYETICKLWEVLPLLRYLQNMLNKQQFPIYFKLLRNGLKNQEGNLFSAASNILCATQSCPSENPYLAMEFMTMHPDEFEEECKQ